MKADNSSKKVLIITPFYRPNIGGAESFAEDLAKALAKKHPVHICTVKLDKPMTFEGMDFKKAFYLTRKLGVALWRMKRRYKYDKVYALGLMSCFLCMCFNISFNAIVFNIFPNCIWIRFIIKRADKIFVEGNTGRMNLLSIGIKKEKIQMFQHWCDQNFFTWKERDNKKMKVLFVGRPIAIKGKHIIHECEKMTKDIEYEYIENCEFKDLPKHYQMADVCVIPSLYNDSFSRICVEAASCGCAVIVSNRGSLPEQVKGFGYAIEPTAEKFKSILEKLQANKNGLERIRLNTFVYSREHFTEKNADCFLLP